MRQFKVKENNYKNYITINLHSNEWFYVDRLRRMVHLPTRSLVKSLIFDRNGMRDALRNRGPENVRPERVGAPVAWRHITLPLTAEEKDALKLRSQKYQKSVSGYCRDILLNRDGFRNMATIMERAGGLVDGMNVVKEKVERTLSLFG